MPLIPPKETEAVIKSSPGSPDAFSQIVRMPDVDALPENRKPILNPQLLLSAVYFLQELRKPGVEPDRVALKDLEDRFIIWYSSAAV